mgnify:FL=1
MSIPIFEQANAFNEQGKYSEALALYDQILAQNHYNNHVLAAMGTILARDQKSVGMAITFLHLAVDKSPNPKKPPQEYFANLAYAYRQSGQHDLSVKYLEAALKIEKTPSTLTNYANSFIEQGNAQKAIELLNQAVKMDPAMTLAHYNLGLALLETGQWERAWDEYEYGEHPGGMRLERTYGGKAKWKGPVEEPDKLVCIYGEQGIGDEIMFASVLPDVLKTNKAIFDCHPRLQTLFEKSFPSVKCYPTRKESELFWPDAEPFDVRFAIGSLGKWYRRSRAAFPGTPYLKADPLLPAGKKLRVGISWTGGKLTQRVARRTVPLSWWRSILNNDCEFVSLQYTEDCEAEIALVEQVQGVTIKQFSEAKDREYYKTAQLVASCDLVISVCTSIVHLAGALGVPCWVMVPHKPAWRYQASGGMPWYRSVRLYRQPAADDGAWIPVVGKVGLDLNDYVDAQREQRKVA